MAEYTIGGPIYSRERTNAHWHNVHLDTRLKPDAYDVQDAIKHFEDCKNNPTIGLLARKHFETNNYPEFKRRNMALLMRAPEVKAAKDSFETTFKKELYPRTNKARKYLIDKNFVMLDYVKPRVKTLGKTLFKMFGR